MRLLLALVSVAAGPLLLSHPASAQSLRGSPSSVDRIYRQALRHDLHFYESAAGVRKAANNGKFVTLRGSSDYKVEGVNFPYVLPTTETFVARLAGQYRAACGERLVITSAVRPKSFRLANSVTKSVHPTGMAIDIRKPRKSSCRSWMRETLLYLEGSGTIDAVEEHHPPHFHVAIFPNQYRQYVQRQGGEVRVASAAKPKPEVRSSSESSTYRVRRGDSLWAIARRHGTSVTRLKRANEMRSSRIVAGQVLVIPETR